MVEALGEGVTGLSVGDRVGYVGATCGAYAAERNLGADLAIRLPESMADALAAASLMKALTMCVLVRRLHRVQAGEAILVQAAAGGVGQLLCSWASHLGATVIGTVGSAEKAQVAKAAGATHIVVYRDEDVAARVAQITRSKGVIAVYDSVGADMFQGSIASLGFEGHLVAFGQASRPVAPLQMSLLAARSLTVSRPIVVHYLRTPDRLKALTAETLEAFEKGIIKPIDSIVLPLGEAPESHRLLETRQSPGGLVLVP